MRAPAQSHASPKARPASARAACACVLLWPFALLAGCKSKPPVDDATLASTVQNQIAADSALSGQPIQATVAGGVVTLNGGVANDAQRTLAARDAAGVQGVKEVRDNIVIGAATASATVQTTQPAPIPVQPAPQPRATIAPSIAPSPRSQPAPRASDGAPIERIPAQTAYNQPAPQVQQQAQPPAPLQPPPPPQPVFRNVTIPAGGTIPVRVTETLDSATTQPDTTFSGVVASDVVVDGLVAIPAGATVSGHVDAVQEAAHFKGNSLLTVSLTSVNRHGEHLAVTSDPYTVSGKGRGANTAEKTGGGAAVGAILGGIFGGGKGAAIGAAAGGGVGAGSNAVTRGQQVQIPSETVVRFHLSNPVSLRVRTDRQGNDHGDHPNSDPNLQPRL